MAQVVVDYVAAVNQYASEIGASVDNVVGDINKLGAKILELENSPDKVTPADQALITESLSLLSGLKAKAQALDEMTAPDEVPPPPAPTP
jgi:hypothetical protein